MESYKKITTVKDVTTKAPNKVSKKAVIATPAKKAVPANYCKQCKDVVVKTKKLNESEDIDQSLAVLDDVDIDSNGVGDSEEVVKSSTYVERPREERKRMFLDRMSQFQDGIDSRAREKLDSDEEYKKFLNYREKVRAEELDMLSREWDAEEDRLERDATAWAKDRFGDDYIEVDDEEDVATDDSSDNSSPEDSEDFWSKTVILNGEEMTREEARKKCRRTILQIDSKSNGDELDADDEARVVALQDAIREIRRGADEVNVDFNEATCESTIKRCSCGKGRSRKCSCGKKGAHKCSCENNINENKNSNPDLEGLVVDFFTNNPEALKKLQSGEVDIGEIMDKVSFANAIHTGKDMVASTNSPSFQVTRNIARKAQSKLQDGDVESVLDYWSNGNVRTKDGRRITVKSVVNQASKNYSKHLDGLEQVNDPNPKAAREMLNNVSLRVTGDNIDTVTNGMRK